MIKICLRFLKIDANVAQWQSNCFVNSRSGVQIPSLAPVNNKSVDKVLT